MNLFDHQVKWQKVLGVLWASLGIVFSQIAWAQDEQQAANAFSDQDIEFFEKEIRPLLAKYCFECHGPEDQEASLRLDRRKYFLDGGDSGPVIDLENPEDSLLLEVVRYEDDIQMPPDSKLPDAKVKLLEDWVKRGAPWPDEDSEEAESGPASFDIAARVEAHWCWHAPTKPAVPNPRDTTWARDAIDQFLLQRLEQAEISPAADADRATLLRRLYFDLIGLPPAPNAVLAFLQDKSPNAVEKVVDELLASPRFGEHWARKWMDLTRYAETHGHEFDYPIPHAYQYRDYLIRAFNEDVPYHQFVLEHLAGDLLETPRRHPERQFNESVLATGFWFLGEATHGPVDVREDEAGHIENRIDILGKSVLGLTIACARCHDHKFDAISTADYYSLSGFLQSSRKQTVLIDFDQQIEKTVVEAEDLRQKIDRQFQDWLDGLRSSEETTLTENWTTAFSLLRQYPRVTGKGWTVQGEDLRFTPTNRRENVTPQYIEARDQFAWQNDRQMWWRDGKPGDRISLKFDVEAPGTYRVLAKLTKAPDYGIMRIWLDDDEASAITFDGYAPSLTVSSNLEITTQTFSAGEHPLHVEIVDKHSSAVPGYMFGVDFLDFEVSLDEQAIQDWRIALRETANAGADFSSAVERLAQAMLESQHPSLGDPTYVLARLLLSNDPDEALRELRESFSQSPSTIGGQASISEDSALFTTFAPSDEPWFATGWAFSTQNEGLAVMHNGAVAANAATSERYGPAVQGSYRSPTFEISHDKIHYRIRGENVQIRVIIDGFALDTFNPLLFAGLTFNLAATPDFSWVTQGGDLKNYKGHRAYIEINDFGNGWCVLDRVVFGNGEPPTSEAHSLNTALLNELTDATPTAMAEVFSRWALQNLRNQPEAADTASFVNWIAFYDLGSLFANRQLSKELDANNWRGGLKHVVDLTNSLPSPPHAIGMTEGTPEDEYVFIRGNHKLRGPTVPRRNLTALLRDEERYQNLASSGRWEFAHDLIEPDHPLTSRVIVNRLWYHLFGEGLVRSVDNFGFLGTPPTHPELLDYLAIEFVEDGWSIKRMLRRMALTRAYQMSSTPSESAKAADPENLLYHSARVRRLTGEEIRDAILQTSGEFNATMYGPSVPVYLTEFMQGRGRPGKSGPLDGAGRRSVYLEVRRNFLNPMMLAFDTPIPFNAIGRRNVSNVPAQALILMNDPFVLDQATKWAKQIVANTKRSRAEKIEFMVLEALGRPALPEEIKLCSSYLERESQARKLKPAEADLDEEIWRDLGHVIFNMKSFTFLY